MPIPREQLDKKKEVEETLKNWKSYIKISSRAVADTFGIRMGLAYTILKRLPETKEITIKAKVASIIIGKEQQNDEAELLPNRVAQTKTIPEVRNGSCHDDIQYQEVLPCQGRPKIPNTKKATR